MIADWELYRVFLEVARAGSLRKAQDVLKLTQPTIGAKLDKFEKSMGSKVLSRTRTGISLTEIGNRILKIAEEMERLNQKALLQISEGNGISGCLRIACTDGIAGYWLPACLPEFHLEHPKVRLQIKCINPGHLVDMHNGEFDLTVMYARPTDPDLVILAEAPMTLAPLCVTKFKERYGLPKDMEDILNFPVCSQDVHYWEHIDDLKPWTDMLKRHPNVFYRIDASLPLTNVTRAGLGISIQPIAAADVEKNIIVLDFFRCSFQLYMVCHKSMKDYPPLRTVIDLFKQNIFKDKKASLTKRHDVLTKG